MMFHRCVGALVGLAMMGMAGSANAAFLIVDGDGTLLGATDVLVDGTLYDVTFVDGTCFDLYSGCDELADFDFTDQATALLAAQALLDQVFVGVYDTDAALTAGCGAAGICQSWIPYGVVSDTQVDIVFSVNEDNEMFDILRTAAVLVSFDLSGQPRSNFARFTAVPEPSTLLLFGVGLAGLAVFRRRRKHQRD